MTLFTRPMLAAVTVVFALAAAPSADASTGDAIHSRRVSYSDLDLTRDRDVRALYRRLRTAAQDVCRYGAAPETYSEECARAALDASVARVNAPALAALHREGSR
jgi:UrcA family protein